MRRGGPPFIGGEGGLDPHMEGAKPTPNHHTPHSFYRLTTETDHGKAVGGNLPKMKLNGTGRGGATLLVRPHH
jgi:hypothetical protein